MVMTVRAIVCGGGIGGLTAVLALRRAGIEATAYERRAGSSAAGSAITLWSNAMHVLADLGVHERILAAGSPLARFENRTRTGRRLANWPIAEMGERAGYPSVSITRADLYRVLRDATDPWVVDGAEVTTVARAGSGVSAAFADGRVAHADLLIGADGLHSRVREHVMPAAPPRFAGYAVYRAVIPATFDDAPYGTFVQLWGRGSRFGYYRVGVDRTYWFAVVNCDEADGHDAGEPVVLLRDRFAGWTAPVGALLAATANGDISRVRIYDRDPAPVWGTGRVTLLGDAAHPMTFNVGQGACQAIEDAAALTAQLVGVGTGGDLADALRRYERERMRPTAQLVRRARRIGQLAGWQAAPLCAVRDMALRPLLSGPARRQHEMLLTSSLH
jgi:2-polyprenyl-6-methoxyphenol hydroxylase-like FAD-dependent oxidoreductase